MYTVVVRVETIYELKKLRKLCEEFGPDVLDWEKKWGDAKVSIRDEPTALLFMARADYFEFKGVKPDWFAGTEAP